LNVGGLGVFIAPTTKLAVWWRLLSHGAPDNPVHTGHCPVHQPRHQVVGFRPLELWLLGPPGCPVAHRTGTVECPVRRLARAWLLRASGAHYASAGDRWREVAVAPLAHRTVRCTPDSPVNFSGADSRSQRVQSRSPLEHRTLSGVHWTVRCARPGCLSGCL
jgi:hypothetical protein